MTRYALGLDVGGTGIQCGLFEVSAEGILGQNNVWPGSLTTNKGVKPHVAQVASLIKMARSAAEERKGKLVGAGVASPGRFRDGIILPGTSPNMGRNPDEFNEVRLKKRYVLACKKICVHNIPIVVRNDADAMAIGLLERLEQSPEAFPDQKGNTVDLTTRPIIGYLGLGTGLGNSFMRDSKFINDGHLSKIKIAIDSQDIPEFSRVYKLRKKEMQYFDPEKAEANLESLVCTPTLRALAKLETNELLDINISNHQQAIALVGKYLAKGMIAVRNGEIHDINPENEWSDPIKEAAKPTSVYLLGGGVMMGKDNVSVANGLTTAIVETLTLNNEHGIQVVPMGCDNPAVRAAAMLYTRK
jgi:hypothetical protein